jgi:hypothetical protein
LASALQEALWFVFRGDLLLVRDDGDPTVALADSPEEFGNNVLFRREIGVLQGRACWAAEVAPDFEPPKGRCSGICGACSPG